MSDIGSNSIIPIYFIGTLGMVLLALSIFFFNIEYFLPFVRIEIYFLA